jgi:uncharacterized membrane protein SirB2
MSQLAAWYPSLKAIHIGLVLTSGSLFAVRGAAVLAGQRWAMARPWRLLSYAIDSLLLTAGVTLWHLLALHPLRNPWLGTKLCLLLLYIAMGSLAMKRARTQWQRRLSYLAALGILLFMGSIAIAHHPLGVFSK